MNVYEYPTHQELDSLLSRPAHDASHLTATVSAVLEDVRLHGDQAVIKYEKQFDHAELTDLAVTEAEMEEAERLVPEDLKQAIIQAHGNIETFHASQKFHAPHVQVTEGVECWQQAIPIQRVGLYIPGGTAPLFSTVLMLATPARLAGCPQIVLCTPPSQEGKVNPAVLYAARVAGVSSVFKAGGVQAIGAMAYGTESIPQVYKIFGPGNQFVTCAKQQVSMQGVAIDMPAGPSEVAVLADETSRPDFVAADLLSQAEHGADSQVILITTSRTLMMSVQQEVDRQLQLLPRRELAQKSLQYSKLILVKDDQEMMYVANRYAPEHLIIETANYMELSAQVVNAGSVFLGSLTPESAGDYASGTNHTLPTAGWARAYSGVNMDSYIRKVTFQHITPEGVRRIGPAVEKMAAGEGLDAHRNAMTLRLKEVK
ncbi:MAG: histidinol dehydrogenase [Bacteroidaceae bacterium]|nr:histidinol dehydrogenase [Bacteroidaceae bacterium]MCI7081629.1 histidinol dehydrogenase [Paraprevotella sp.]MDD5970710.1 histidinol dehydrogenase [Paraprevotella sp.]MDD6824167.1 histidinol dehydrogenase [Paraprevotella sp.]MDY3097924.1 histidinol dehydrogenase [Bacteroidaceae bacterium]